MMAWGGRGFPRLLFPEFWLSVLGLMLCVAVAAMLVFVGRIPDEDAPLFYLKGAALLAAGWWLLLGTRVCALVYRMVPLRLPGIGRALAQGVLLHLVLSIGLPWLVLCGWLPGSVGGVALLGALWLGSTLGLLLVSMPMALPVLPLVIIGMDWDAVANPVFCALSGVVALCLAGLAWRWQLRGIRSALLAPLGVELAGSPLHILHSVRQLRPSAGAPGGARRTRHTAALSSRDLLAAALGPRWQTMRQLYGRRGQWLVYLVFAGVSLALLSVPIFLPAWQAGGSNAFLGAMSVAALFHGVLQPASRLSALYRMRSGTLAELHLMPGMPSARELPVELMRQVSRCLGERIVLLALALFAALGLSYPLGRGWMVWWACLALLLLVLGVASAWLAWLGRNRSGWWVTTLGVGAVMAIATNVFLLSSARPLPGLWLTVWAGWLALAAAVFWLLQRRRGPALS